jgi:hypothetical protein
MDNAQSARQGNVDEPIRYDTDIVAWANEQAGLIRAGRFDLLDIANIADEIEDVGRAERRELTSRMAVLIAHLLKWQHQPSHRGRSWERTIKEQRRQAKMRLEEVPSLRPKLRNVKWLSAMWSEAVVLAIKDTGYDDFPEICPWNLMQEVLKDGWLPD